MLMSEGERPRPLVDPDDPINKALRDPNQDPAKEAYKDWTEGGSKERVFEALKQRIAEEPTAPVKKPGVIGRIKAFASKVAHPTPRS
jgi:hypothetical protein